MLMEEGPSSAAVEKMIREEFTGAGIERPSRSDWGHAAKTAVQLLWSWADDERNPIEKGRIVEAAEKAHAELGLSDVGFCWSIKLILNHLAEDQSITKRRLKRRIERASEIADATFVLLMRKESEDPMSQRKILESIQLILAT